jgi:xylan 1,4-beta-xylosidase
MEMGLPLVVTEFNAGLGIDASDGPYASSFLLHQLVAFQNTSNIQTLSFWTFSDIFEEQGFQSIPYTQQFGLQTIYNVPKPSYRAFQMIHDVNVLPSYTVQTIQSQGTVDVIALSTSGTDELGVFYNITLLCTNFDIRGNSVNNEIVNLIFLNSSSFEFPSVASFEFIDQFHANAEAVWRLQGMPTYPSPKQIEDEMHASELNRLFIKFTQSGTSPSLSFILLPYGSVRIQFTLTQLT